MFSAKDFADDFERKARPPHHRWAGKSSELFDSHGREQTHLTIGNEEDLPASLTCRSCHFPECWQLGDVVPIPPLGRGREGGEGGEGEHCTIQKHNARIVFFLS